MPGTCTSPHLTSPQRPAPPGPLVPAAQPNAPDIGDPIADSARSAVVPHAPMLGMQNDWFWIVLPWEQDRALRSTAASRREGLK
jgi:hypothetical protein